jgi:hypothetical protein
LVKTAFGMRWAIAMHRLLALSVCTSLPALLVAGCGEPDGTMIAGATPDTSQGGWFFLHGNGESYLLDPTAAT